MSSTESTTEKMRAQRRGGIGVAHAMLFALTLLTFAACGPTSRQRQTMMLVSEQAEAAKAASAGAGGTGATTTAVRTVVPGTVGPGPGVATPAGVTVVDVATYRVAPGDILDIRFPYHPEESQKAPVRNDGRINMPVTGDIEAAGFTVAELQEIIVQKSSATLRGPEVNIVIAELAEHRVFVTGQVAKPGFVPFKQGMTSMQAIVERGGFLDDAKMTDVVHLHRRGKAVESRKVDLENVFEGTAPDVNTLAPNDILIVPRTFIGDADVFVDQWIRGLLPSIPQPGIDLPLLFF